MTSVDHSLERLAPRAAWEPDWADVLARAGVRPARLLTTRRGVLVLAALAAVLVPLAALGAANDWWFFRFGSAPTPLSAPVVVRGGEWSGHAWQLVAFPSKTDGLCFSITPAGSTTRGEGGAMSCGPMVGVARTAETKATPDMTITYLSGAAGAELPAYIAGPVDERATEVEVRFDTGDVLRAPTFSAPDSVGHVRFYAAQLPEGLSMPRPSRTTFRFFVDRLAGLDREGNVVACLVPRTAVNGASPLSDCR